MGTLTYDFLKDSLLLNPSMVRDEYSRVSDADLIAELARYRDYCVEHKSELQAELPTEPSILTVFSGRGLPSIAALRQRALYVGTHVIEDPMFDLSWQPSGVAVHARQALGFSGTRLDRPALAAAARFMNTVTPLVAHDYVKFLPTSQWSEPPGLTTINYAADGYASVLPTDLLEWFRTRADVEALRQLADGRWVSEDGFSGPSRGLFVGFSGHPSVRGSVFHLFKTEVLDIEEESRAGLLAMTIPSEPPGVDEFEVWKSQSINQASRALFDEVVSDIAIAEDSMATFLTSSPFIDGLLSRVGLSDGSIQSETARAVARFELPFLEGVDLPTLMKVRTEETDAFRAFRVELERHFREIRMETDPGKIASLTENAFHELTEARVQEVDIALKQSRKSLGANATVALASLAASVHTAGWSLIALLLAGVRGYKAYEAHCATKSRPAHLVWRLKSESARS